MFLAALRGLAHALTEPHQRIDDDRRARQAHQRQLPVEIQQQAQIADERQRLADQIADGLGHRLLDLRDVARHARHQLSARPAREEARRLAEHVAEQRVPHVADHELPHVGHQVGGEERADALHQRGDDDEQRDLTDAALGNEDLVEDRFDEIREPGRGRAIGHHRQQGGGEPAPVRSPIAKQPEKMIHKYACLPTRRASYRGARRCDTPADAGGAIARRCRQWHPDR